MPAIEKQSKGDETVNQEKRKEAPSVVRVKSRGQVSGTLERFAEMYRQKYPDRAVRYVYDPTHKPELSGVMGRQASGYEIVTFDQIDHEKGSKEAVRVGDLVLMSIDKKTKEAMKAERLSRATDMTRSVERKFNEEIRKAAEDSTPRDHRGPATRPIGSARIEERSFEYEREQRED